MVYLLDANVFIEAHRRHYGMDFCPAFWDWLIEQHQGGKVFSIEKVGAELRAGQDNLANWAAALGAQFFLPPDQRVQLCLHTVADWVRNQRYSGNAVNTFLRSADYYLVSHALAHGHVVVTHEVPSNSKQQVKIPDACKGLNVKWMPPFEMLRNEGARFVLGA